MRLVLGLSALSVAILLAGLMFGELSLSLFQVVSTFFWSTTDPSAHIIVTEIRAPRALAAWLAGFALGMSGAAMQGLLRNPLAEPAVLGVSATASLFAATTLYLGVSLPALSTPLAAIAGAALAVTILLLAAPKAASATTLILIGVGLSSLSGALLSLLLSLSPNPFALSDMINWLLGSVANRSTEDLLLTAPFILSGATLCLLAGAGLRALSLGEETATSLGANLPVTRALTIAGAGFATGASVALAGAIGFVGIVAPHLLRPLVGHDPARLLLPSGLLGGLLLLVADTVLRLTPALSSLGLGVIAALLGAPAFIWIAARWSARHG